MLLNARKVFYEIGSHANIILLGIEDVTGKRALEREKDELLRQKMYCSMKSSTVSPIVSKLSPALLC
jgi:hypothetical protein